MKDSIASFRKWFFAEGDASSAAAIRIAFGGLVLFTLWDLYPVMDLLLGKSGYYGTLDPQYLPRVGITALLYYFDSPVGLRFWFGIGIVCAAFTLIGLYSRAAVFGCLFCLLLAHKRNPFMLFGADMVLFNIGLWLMFLGSDRAWSVDSWIRDRLRREKPRQIPLWPIRALQIQMALLYFRTALAKSGTDSWQDGSAIYYALSVLGNDVFPQIMEWKLFLTLLTYGTVCVEFSFPILAFWKPTRWLALTSAVMLHVGIDLLMSIRLFGLVMIAGLASFVRPSEWITVERTVLAWISKARSMVTSVARLPGYRQYHG